MGDRSAITGGIMEPDIVAAPRRNPVIALARVTLHWLIKIPVLLVLGLRWLLGHRAVRYALVALLVVSAIGWQAAGTIIGGVKTNAQAPTTAAQMTADGDIRLARAEQLLPPSPVVERYIQALADYDGATMWSLMGEDLRTFMQENNDGSAPERLQQGLDGLRQRGGRYVSGTYVAGTALTDGQHVYFYILEVETPVGNVEMPYTYTLGTDGKLAGIDQE